MRAPNKKTKKKATKLAPKRAKAKQSATKAPGVSQLLDALIGKYDAKQQALLRSVRRSLRARFPWADELVYDYSHSLVIGFTPTGKGYESAVALSQRDDGLRLYFNQGPKLADPTGILQGSAKQTRFIMIDSARTLKLPAVDALINAAAQLAKPPLDPGRRGTLIMQTSSAKPARKK